MTSTELWDINYHAMKKWISLSTEEEIRKAVDKLMNVSVEIAINNI